MAASFEGTALERLLAEHEVAPEFDADEECPVCCNEPFRQCREAAEWSVRDIAQEVDSDMETVAEFLLEHNLDPDAQMLHEMAADFDSWIDKGKPKGSDA